MVIIYFLVCILHHIIAMWRYDKKSRTFSVTALSLRAVYGTLVLRLECMAGGMRAFMVTQMCKAGTSDQERAGGMERRAVVMRLAEELGKYCQQGPAALSSLHHSHPVWPRSPGF